MIVKRVKNVRLTGNKVSARYNYITHREKASWIFENTFDRFDFAVKKRFKDKQDTTHFVASFSRILTEEEKLKAREVIANFFLEKFGNEYFLSIAEHSDTDQTHYQILISRNIITSKMVSTELKGNKYKELIMELKRKVEQAGLSNEKEKEINRKYEQSNEFVRQFGYFEYRNYKELQERLKDLSTKEKAETILSLLPIADDKRDSYKAITRIISELVSELLNKNELTNLNNFMEQAGIKIFLEETQKGRERIKIEFVKDWKFLGNAKTTKFTIKNLNKEVSNHLKQVLKEYQNGITRIDTFISREIGELERQIQSDRRRYTAFRTGETAVRAGDREQADRIETIRRRISELSARIGEFKAGDTADTTGKTAETDGVREVKQRIRTTAKGIKSIAREFGEVEKIYKQFRAEEREIIRRNLRLGKDRYSTKEYTGFEELEQRFGKYTGYISGTKSYISGLFDKFGKLEFEGIGELENRFSDIQRRFEELTREDTNRDRKDRNEKSDITRAISEIERELSELTTELERARATANRVEQETAGRNREDTKDTKQDNNRNRRTQELSNINNDNSINTEFINTDLYSDNANQKDILGDEEMISLEFAKRNIDIGEFAEKVFGYKYKKEKGKGRWRTYKNKETGDIILVSKNYETGHFVYKNIDNTKDEGTIIDFIQNRMGGKDKFNLGKVRKLLTDYWNNFEKIEKIEIDENIEKGQELDEELKELNIYDNYLVKERKISPDLLEEQYIYEDETKYKNIVFELFGHLEKDRGKRIGLAKYNKGFKQIIGKKGIWTTKIDDMEKAKNIVNIVITESPIDALSYLELEDRKARNGEAGAVKKENTFLISTQGQIGKNTIDYVYSYVKVINQLSDKKVFITLAFDNDKKGQEMSMIMKNQLERKLKEDNIDMKIIIEKPKLKDWNEDLVKEKEKQVEERKKTIIIEPERRDSLRNHRKTYKASMISLWR